MSDTSEPDVPALEAWHDAHPDNGLSRLDQPKTRLWFPYEPPFAVLQTIDRGCEQPPVLPDPEKPMVDVHLGTGISVGGYLAEMEAYFAAVVDAVRLARWQADTITDPGSDR